MDIIINKTNDFGKALEIAKQLPDFFNKSGLKSIEQGIKNHLLFGAYSNNEMLGFATYKEINPDTVEMFWLGVIPEAQRKGIGKKLVEESLKNLAVKYKVCEVKTLSETDPYEPYKKTREFYKSLNFIPIETIHPYPGWDNNACQIFVRFLRK